MRMKLMSYLALDWLILNAIRITLTARRRGRPARQIPNGLMSWFAPPREKTIRYHPIDYSKPVPHVRVPDHPFMSKNGSNNMHC
ncbi:MAG: hypothetical protein IBX68_07540, partial [Dehalococcoidia bacterium]|nr:hypothetical protein [Dehalococcoidia bacterium]